MIACTILLFPSACVYSLDVLSTIPRGTQKINSDRTWIQAQQDSCVIFLILFLRIQFTLPVQVVSCRFSRSPPQRRSQHARTMRLLIPFANFPWHGVGVGAGEYNIGFRSSHCITVCTPPRNLARCITGHRGCLWYHVRLSARLSGSSMRFWQT